MNKILITDEIDSYALETLRHKYHVEINSIDHVEDPENYIGIISMLSDSINRESLKNFVNLKVISNYAVGFNNIDTKYCSDNNIAVGNTPDVLTDATADLAITLLLMALRNTKQAMKNIEKNQWLKWEPLGFLGQSLKGKTIGIYGMGRIGENFAKKLHYGWNCKIIYHNRNKKNVDLPASYVSLNTLLAESDIISLHSPSTPENYQVFNLENFKKMKKSSILVNTARGQLINEDHLYFALKEGLIYAAGVDVTDPEPINEMNPLLMLNNFYCLPHIGSATTDARKEMAKICVENIISGINNGVCRYNVLS